MVAALVCDVAVQDPSTGKASLIGVFVNVHVGRFPTQRPISLYFKLVDGEGLYNLEVRYVQADTGEVLANAETELTVTDRLSPKDMHIPFPPLAIPNEGRYEFQIWANSMFLGSTSIRVVQQGV